MTVSLIIPAYNEEEAISPVIEEYYPFVDEIIVVDDGSTDKTYELACAHQDDKCMSISISIIRER